jgi:NADPH:quinone reductase-like Zn-dependent oxidoreductase
VRALTIDAHGGLEQLRLRTDIPEPTLSSDTDVRIRIRAAALNHLDLFVFRGLPGVTIAPGWIMGGDAAGVVDAVGGAVRGIAPGDRVVVNPGISDHTCEYCLDGEQSLCIRYKLLGEHLPGTIADYLVVPATNVRVIRAGISWEQAAAFSLATLTAWRMLVPRARVTASDTVLIWGIGGGVAVAALQIARRLGARVWVTSGSDEKLERARELGAERSFNHNTQDVPREVRALTNKRGVDVVVDNVGAATWGKSLLVLGKRGRLVTCGATSGPMVETDVRRMFWNQWTLMGSTMGNDAEYTAIVDELNRGELLPPVDLVVPMEEGRRAFERLEAGEQFGKIVIRVSED